MQTPTHSHRNNQNDFLTTLARPNAHACTRTRKALTELTEFINTWGEFMQFAQAYAHAHARRALRKLRKFTTGRGEYAQFTQPLARARARVGHSENSENSSQVGGEKQAKMNILRPILNILRPILNILRPARNAVTRINKSTADGRHPPITSITHTTGCPVPALGRDGPPVINAYE